MTVMYMYCYCTEFSVQQALSCALLDILNLAKKDYRICILINFLFIYVGMADYVFCYHVFLIQTPRHVK